MLQPSNWTRELHDQPTNWDDYLANIHWILDSPVIFSDFSFVRSTLTIIDNPICSKVCYTHLVSYPHYSQYTRTCVLLWTELARCAHAWLNSLYFFIIKFHGTPSTELEQWTKLYEHKPFPTLILRLHPLSRIKKKTETTVHAYRYSSYTSRLWRIKIHISKMTHEGQHAL